MSEIAFTTMPYENENGTETELVVSLTNTSIDIGPPAKHFPFEFRPNNIIHDIFPRKSILR